MAATPTLARLLERIEETLEGRERVAMAELRDAVGARSFGPVLLLLGLAALTPLGVIPGLPTAFAAAVALVAGQLALGHEGVWLPGPVARRTVGTGRLRQALKAARRPAGWLDRLARPRLETFARGPWMRSAAAACVLVAFAIPPLELVPFGVAAPAAAITAFGLGLTARDGALVLAALAASIASAGLIAWAIWG